MCLGLGKLFNGLPKLIGSWFRSLFNGWLGYKWAYIFSQTIKSY